MFNLKCDNITCHCDFVNVLSGHTTRNIINKNSNKKYHYVWQLPIKQSKLLTAKIYSY